MRAPEFWRRKGVAAGLLAPLGWVYGTVSGLRAGGEGRRMPVPVLCVGNLVAGGAGKTPVALDLGRRLAAHGVSVHFLSRGYGGRERGPLRVEPGRHGAADVGDEPLLLAETAPTWVSADRVAGAEAAVAAGAQAIVMDDGFQNPSLAKDLSLIIADGGYGFGNGRVMPAGPLREPLGLGLARAAAVVVIGEDRAGVAGLVGERCPLIRARLVPGPGAEDLKRRPLVAFAGIGRPEKFFETLDALGCDMRARHAFPDHHPYSAADLARLRAEAEGVGGRLVTTAKDAVRLDAEARNAVDVLTITLEWEDEAAIDPMLEPLLAHVRG